MERKQAQCLANAGANRTKFKAQCSDMRIAGSDVAAELAALVSQLPVEFDKVVNTVQSEPFGQAMAYYRAFLDFTLGKWREIPCNARSLVPYTTLTPQNHPFSPKILRALNLQRAKAQAATL